MSPKPNAWVTNIKSSGCVGVLVAFTVRTSIARRKGHQNVVFPGLATNRSMSKPNAWRKGTGRKRVANVADAFAILKRKRQDLSTTTIEH